MKREIIEEIKNITQGLNDISCVDCKSFNGVFGVCDENRKCDEAIVDAVSLLCHFEKHHNKYRWHDLRENPDDLPEDSQQVDVCDERGNRYYTHIDIYSTNNWSRKVWHYSLNGVEPIAWREIEPFEDGGV